MTNNTIPNVPRELLEVIEQTWRIHYKGGPVTTDIAADAIEKGLGQLRALLSATSPAGVDGLEVIGWYTEDHLDDKSATTYSREVADRWLAKGWPVTGIANKSDAQAIIDGLRGEVEQLGNELAETELRALKFYHRIGAHVDLYRELRTERDEQAQRIGELEGLLREVRNGLSCENLHHKKSEQHAFDEPCKVLVRIDAALSAGKEGE